MKLHLALFVVIGSCLLYTPGTSAQEPSSTTPLPELPDGGNPRFFFFNSDPCTNMLYQFLNITDAKCSLQCYIQAGFQQGGYCDDNQVCQCNQIA